MYNRSIQSQTENKYEELLNKILLLQDHAKNHILFIKDKSTIHRVKIAEILWIEAMDNYSVIKTINKKYVVNSFLKNIEERLSKFSFVRVHRSYIVPLEKIEELQDNCVYITSKRIPVSKSYKKSLLQKMNFI